jgi:hypothetical protein
VNSEDGWGGVFGQLWVSRERATAAKADAVEGGPVASSERTMARKLSGWWWSGIGGGGEEIKTHSSTFELAIRVSVMRLLRNTGISDTSRG